MRVIDKIKELLKSDYECVSYTEEKDTLRNIRLLNLNTGCLEDFDLKNDDNIRKYLKI